MGRLFGTNGIRGVFGSEMTVSKAYDMAAAIAAHLHGGAILVGYDGRSTSPAISRAVCSAISYMGTECAAAGLVPTPCLQYVAKEAGYAGAIMVTASHNPPEYNGLKVIASDGVEISRRIEQDIERTYFEGSTSVPSTFGSIKRYEGAIEKYTDAISLHVDVEAIRKKRLTIVIDAGNGAQAAAAPILCEKLGCNVTLINGEIDGAFPGRGPEPTPENLNDLAGMVRKTGADLGVAFDGDGDRSVFCDERGQILTGDKSALLLVSFLLKIHHNSKIITCINSGSAIERLARKYDCKVARTKVGSVEVSRRMVADGAAIGFEENGGFMYGPHNQVRDGAMTMALMLNLMASGKSVSEMASGLPPSFTGKTKVSCGPEDAKKLLEELCKEYPDADTTDGIKITDDEQNWVMIRPSGTEPIIRIYAEADSAPKLERSLSEHVARARSILSGS